MRTIWPFARLTAAVAVLAAVIAQLSRTVALAQHAETAAASHLPTIVWNFFSFFTIQSNLLAAAALVTGVVWAWRRGTAVETPLPLARLLLCATTYMVITGVVYNLLLRGVPLVPGATVGWSNEVLHVVVPLFMVADLLLAPGPRRLPWTTLWLVAIYPIAWLAYTFARSPLITSPRTGEAWWYPYPFLDAHNFANGFWGVLPYIAGIAAAILSVGALCLLALRARTRAGRADAEAAASADT